MEAEATWQRAPTRPALYCGMVSWCGVCLRARAVPSRRRTGHFRMRGFVGRGCVMITELNASDEPPALLPLDASSVKNR